jgi:hypothetical protein
MKMKLMIASGLSLFFTLSAFAGMGADEIARIKVLDAQNQQLLASRKKLEYLDDWNKRVPDSAPNKREIQAQITAEERLLSDNRKLMKNTMDTLGSKARIAGYGTTDPVVQLRMNKAYQDWNAAARLPNGRGFIHVGAAGVAGIAGAAAATVMGHKADSKSPKESKYDELANAPIEEETSNVGATSRPAPRAASTESAH